MLQLALAAEAHVFSEELLVPSSFGTKDAYLKEIMVADLNKLANLIKICGFLMQTKVHLFWGG